MTIQGTLSARLFIFSSLLDLNMPHTLEIHRYNCTFISNALERRLSLDLPMNICLSLFSF